MANKEALSKKSDIIKEVTDNIKASTSFVVFEYHGLKVFDLTELRRQLKAKDCELKVYKNTLVQKALADLNIDLGDSMTGSKAIIFGQDEISPIKILAAFSKKHPEAIITIGYINNKVTDKDLLAEYAKIPERSELLTMIAGSLIQNVKNVAIALDLYKQKLEKNN